MTSPVNCWRTSRLSWLCETNKSSAYCINPNERTLTESRSWELEHQNETVMDYDRTRTQSDHCHDNLRWYTGKINQGIPHMNHKSRTKMDANTRLLLTSAHQLIEMITKVRGSHRKTLWVKNLLKTSEQIDIHSRLLHLRLYNEPNQTLQHNEQRTQAEDFPLNVPWMRCLTAD